MSTQLTIKKALKDLRTLGYKIHSHPNKEKMFVWGTQTYTEREIYRLHTSTFERGRSYKRIVKHLSNGKDRSSTRDALRTENFEAIPQNKRTKTEDPWGWD